MNILYYISIGIFIIYIGVTLAYFGVPRSLSNTYYQWEAKRRNLGALFTLFMWGITFPLLIFWVEVLPSIFVGLPFFACASLMFVGAASAFKLPLTKQVHFVATYLAVLSSYLWTFLYAIPSIAFASIIFFLVIALADKKNKTFWLEMGAFANIYIQLFILMYF